MLAPEVLEVWRWPGKARAERVEDGLINQTYWIWVDGERAAVLQRLNTAIFAPEVHVDIDAVTARLAERGVLSPRLIRTVAGELWHTADSGEVWRVLTLVGDRTVHRVVGPEEAAEAGELVGRFHAALDGWSTPFRSPRTGVHDTVRHMARLKAILATHRHHRLFDATARVADAILTGWATWQGPTELPRRVIHGDLKISNVRFQGARAAALIDLDTVGWGTLDLELGDAFRSWCNPRSEDTENARFHLDLFEAAMGGYARGCREAPPSDLEWRSVVAGTERIAWELAARFAHDALAESYFGWNPRYGGHGEHNLLRAKGQVALAASVRAQRSEAEGVLDRIARTP